MSGDEKMREAYSSSDPYLTFAKQAGAVPEDATKQSHGLATPKGVLGRVPNQPPRWRALRRVLERALARFHVWVVG